MLKKLKQQILTEGGSFPIFLDNQSTTVVDPVVLNKMLPFFNIKYGNPHSRSHVLAWEAEEACEISRELIARVIGANKKEIIFTSGATESNNLAIKGVSMFYQDKRKHIITLMTEHKCVLDTCRVLERNGFYVTYLPVETNGIINLNQLAEVITQDTLLVSIMAVNNEIGVIQPLKEIGQICKEKEVFFHSDIAQGFGKIPINVDDMHIDLASISGHKIYAPKGIGALYIRRRDRRVRLVPLINGGGQERGFRSGTLSTPLVVGLGIAAKIAVENMHDNFVYIKRLFNFFVSEIEKKVDMVFLNGDKYQRYPGNVNFSFAFVEGESLILAVSDLAISSGSACTSNSLESSYVLKALGVDDALAHTSLRFGFSKFTTLNEVKFASELLISKISRLRNLSPLWEMYKNGINIKSIKWNMH